MGSLELPCQLGLGRAGAISAVAFQANSAAADEEILPTFETQKLARAYVLDIPAPRGQITDRTGAPLAQNKISYNLAIIFPTPLDFSDPQAVAFTREKIGSRRETDRSPNQNLG